MIISEKTIHTVDDAERLAASHTTRISVLAGKLHK